MAQFGNLMSADMAASRYPTSRTNVGYGGAPAAQPFNIQPYAQEVYNDLNSGDYSDAWKIALSTSTQYNTNYGTTTKDPLLAALENSAGLKAFDPNKQWDANSEQAFYNAFQQNAVFQGKATPGIGGSNESLGKNAYGLWGNTSQASISKDAAANIAQEGNTPDVMRFVGARPSQSFLSKYGADIAALVATVVTAGAASPLLAAAAGAGTMIAANAAEGKATTWGSVARDVAAGAIGAAIPGVGAELGDALGVGATIGTGLAGAAGGALRSEITGGNVGFGALVGGIGGAIGASGVKGDLGNLMGGGAVGNTIAGLGVGAAQQYGTQALGGALGVTGQPGQPATARVGAPPATMQAQSMATNPVGGALMGSTLGAPGMSMGATGPVTGAGPYGYNSNPIAAWQPAIPGLAPQSGPAVTPTTNGGTPQPFDFSSVGSTIGSLIGPVGGLLQTGAGVYGAQNYGEAIQKGNAAAIGQQQQTLGNITNLYNPQVNAGNNAFTQLTNMQSGGPGGTPDYSGFENMPGYQFALSQGTQAIQRQAAANGGAFTPNTVGAIGQYVTGTAMQDYNTYVQQLLNTAQLGSQANQSLTGANLTTGSNISQLMANTGQANASAVAGAAGAVGAGASGITNTLGGIAKTLFGGSPGSGTPGQAGNPMSGIGAGLGRLFGNGGPTGNGDPFSGTGQVGNGGNYSLYNQNNGPSAGDISNLTGGAGTIDPTTFNMPDQMPTFNLPDPSTYDPTAAFDPNNISFDTGSTDVSAGGGW